MGSYAEARAARSERPPCPQAHEILSRNFASCELQLETIKKELAVIRDSVTILEVSIARVYNYDVSRRRALKGKAEAEEASA